MTVKEEKGMEGKGDKWRLFVKLIHTIWSEGKIPQQMSWMTIMLLPRGRVNYRGIGLFEPFWKVIEVLMDQRLQVIEIHDCLHGFLKGRGPGTATTKAKLS